MSDSEITTAPAPAPAPAPATHTTEQQQSMETETQPHAPQSDSQQEPKKLDSNNLKFSIWPPTQRTRDAVIARLVETLTTPSVLSKRYGSMPTDEAGTTAHAIESEAFSVADAAASAEDDGIEVLQVYSKEISKRMLDAVKVRASAGSVTSADDNKNGAEHAGGEGEEVVSASVEAEA